MASLRRAHKARVKAMRDQRVQGRSAVPAHVTTAMQSLRKQMEGMPDTEVERLSQQLRRTVDPKMLDALDAMVQDVQCSRQERGHRPSSSAADRQHSAQAQPDALLSRLASSAAAVPAIDPERAHRAPVKISAPEEPAARSDREPVRITLPVDSAAMVGDAAVLESKDVTETVSRSTSANTPAVDGDATLAAEAPETNKPKQKKAKGKAKSKEKKQAKKMQKQMQSMCQQMCQVMNLDMSKMQGMMQQSGMLEQLQGGGGSGSGSSGGLDLSKLVESVGAMFSANGGGSASATASNASGSATATTTIESDR
jgi:hypothetical protein